MSRPLTNNVMGRKYEILDRLKIWELTKHTCWASNRSAVVQFRGFTHVNSCNKPWHFLAYTKPTIDHRRKLDKSTLSQLFYRQLAPFQTLPTSKLSPFIFTDQFSPDKTRNLPHSGWYPQTETWYQERPINVKSWNKVRYLAWILCFSILPQKFKVQNCRHFRQEKDTTWVENFYEIALFLAK